MTVISEYLFLFGWILIFGAAALHLDNVRRENKTDKKRRERLQRLLAEGKSNEI